MASARHKATEGKQVDAVASLRKLHNRVVHVTVSNPENRADTLAEFEFPVSDSVISALDSYLRGRPERSSDEPNARLAAALEESGRIQPRFKSAQELFDALEKEGQG